MARAKNIRDLCVQNHKNGKTNKQIYEFLNAQVPLRTIRRWIQTDGIPRVKPSGRPKSATTINKINKTRCLFNKGKSGRNISQTLNISPRSVRRIKNELGFHPYFRITVPMLSEKQKKARIDFARWWRKDKAGGLSDKEFMFSDEKKFEIDGGINRQNDRVYSRSREEANLNGGLVGKSK